MGKWLVSYFSEPVTLSMLQFLAFLIASMLVSSVLTHYYDGLPTGKLPPAPGVCPPNICSPNITHPSFGLARHWKDTPNDNGERF